LKQPLIESASFSSVAVNEYLAHLLDRSTPGVRQVFGYTHDAMSPIDQYAGNPRVFPVLNHWNYLNHAGVSPLAKPVADAIRKYVDCFEADAYLGELSFGVVKTCREALAKLVAADPMEISLLKNTGEAISTIALGIDWKPGDRIVTAACEYPANIYPWMEAAKRFDLELIMAGQETRADGARVVPTQALLAAADHPKCRMVALSHVQYGSGQRMAVDEIGAWCRARGKFFCVDAIQSLGAMPLNMRNIDFLAAGSQKWMLGPMGAAFLYVRRELCQAVRPLAIGAYSVVDPDNYTDINYTLQTDARKHECGTPTLPTIAGWAAALEMLLTVGVDAIAQRIKMLTDRLIDGLRRKDFQIASPRGANEWSGIVSFTPAGDVNLAAIAKRLRSEHRIEILVRENRLRASPHFYNTVEQMDELVDAL
jgi:selenocysteine lyase/cysteine desulfurase